MHARSNRALSRGTRAPHMMVPQPRGWVGLSSTSICTHTHASRTLICATASPRSMVGVAVVVGGERKQTPGGPPTS